MEHPEPHNEDAPSPRGGIVDPSWAVPIARPVDYAAASTAQPVFPAVEMPRWHALLDVAALGGFFLCCNVLLSVSGLLAMMMEWWSQGGLFGFNILLGLATLGAIAVMLRIRRQSPATIGLNRASLGRICLAVLIAVPACHVAGAILNLAYIALSGFDVAGFVEERVEFFEVVPEIPWGWMLALAIFVGIHEEIFFRGFLLSRLRTGLRSRAAAIILTSVIFGSLHVYQGYAAVFQTAAVGAVLAVITTYTRTLWPAIIAHALIDAIGLLLAGPVSDMLKEMDMVPTVVG